MTYLQCPECRLTVPAAAYYLRGDECPRCLTPMDPAPRLRRDSAATPLTGAPETAPAAAAAD